MKMLFVMLAWVLATAPAFAQQHPGGIAVIGGGPTRPMPEDSVPEAERLTFLAGFIDGDAPLLERRQALNRALRLAARRDRPTLQEWRARETEFYRREAARIDVSALPLPARPCDNHPDAQSSMPTCGERHIDYETGNRYEVLAEAAHLAGDPSREMSLRESAAIFMGGADPHITYWMNLAARAADAGEDQTARRVCSYMHATQYRRAQGDPFNAEKSCTAYAAFKAQRWADWLAVRAHDFAATPPDSTEALLSYCVAFAQTGGRADAIAACDRAAAAATVHEARLSEAAGAADSDTLALQINGGASGQYNEILNQIQEEVALREVREGHRISMAVVVASMWAQERPRLDAAIVACRHSAERGSDDAACVFPTGMRTLNISFQNQADALADIMRRIGSRRSTSAGTSPSH